MTTFFDRVQHLLLELKPKMTDAEYLFLRDYVDATHEYQHKMNSHKLDTYLFERLMTSPFARDILRRIGYYAAVEIFEERRNKK